MKILFFSIIPFLLLTGCKEAEPITYYLPKDFEGVFAVVYSQPQGTENKLSGQIKFYIPANGILLTKEKFSDGWRHDVFLRPSTVGYDTLQTYLSNKDSSGQRFDNTYYKKYSSDGKKVCINFRQIVNRTFNRFDSLGNKIGSCNFQYELITIGKAETLSDSLGEKFIEKLDSYLQREFCK